MNSDAERYRLCIQCLEERNASRVAIAKDAPSAIFFGSCPISISRMQKAIIDEEMWLNKWDNGTYGSDLFGFREDRLCRDCPYVLEHVILSGESMLVKD